MGVIYLLYNDDGYGYIGRTENLKQRLIAHKSKGEKTNSKRLGSWKCEILEECADDCLVDYERYWYDFYNELFPNMIVNNKVPNSSYIETQKRRRDKERKINSLKPKRVYKRDTNRISKKDYDVIYRERKRKGATSIVCECGGKYKLSHKSTHLKTTLHLTSRHAI